MMEKIPGFEDFTPLDLLQTHFCRREERTQKLPSFHSSKLWIKELYNGLDRKTHNLSLIMTVENKPMADPSLT